MMKKLLWPATLLAAFALPAACGGGSTDSDMGGAGGSDGSGGDESTGGNDPTGGRSTGGGAGEGGQGGSGSGGGPVVEQPETCSDGDRNEMETDVDCGGPDCDPCEDDAACRQPSDCDSEICDNLVCAAPECGDRVTNGDEECDDGGDSGECDDDCTLVECGDGHFNPVVEVCEPDPDLDVWQRCGRTCIHGVDLDGTWRTNNIPGTNSPWERLTGDGTPNSSYYGESAGLQSFHYQDETTFYELSSNSRYDIGSDSWSALVDPPPFGVGDLWPIGAVDSQGIWVARLGSIFRFDLVDQTWDEPITSVPNGSIRYTSAVFDGDGYIWYGYYDEYYYDPVLLQDGTSFLVRVDPADGSFDTYSWSYDAPSYNMIYPRLAYDPVTQTLVMSSYFGSPNLLRFDLETETFSLSAQVPDAAVPVGTACGDRAGGFYFMDSAGVLARYDIAADTFLALPVPLVALNAVAPCMVSEVGYLYLPGGDIDPVTMKPGFARLRLNHR